MSFYIKFNDHVGSWANVDVALKYLKEGFRVFYDNVDWQELSLSELEALEGCDRKICTLRESEE